LAAENRKLVLGKGKIGKNFLESEKSSEIGPRGKNLNRGKCIIASGGWTPLVGGASERLMP